MDDGCCLKPLLETQSECRQHFGFRRKDYDEESVQKELIEHKEQDGWEVIRINKKTARWWAAFFEVVMCLSAIRPLPAGAAHSAKSRHAGNTPPRHLYQCGPAGQSLSGDHLHR